MRSLQRVGYATVGIKIRGAPPFAKSAKDGPTREIVALSAEDKKMPISCGRATSVDDFKESRILVDNIPPAGPVPWIRFDHADRRVVSGKQS